ncbi:hypothetical protein FOYG_09597 [Fusarium oxysporum NRRL 32931]|uniref:Uncharacterized protein n=1 Tax=Fusarium oxysporum NRRL 32931 TaxID=660029 RepID=W9I796_FUSOX|nr:hypothetical protein FOYG_09597 [Fusarium oxysporum NRRL 32931]EWY88371.1 hypothetical protein FOYG_09597 [Fusarium oxysporum NRRL 32931]KAJ0153683.1 Nascent polypeptide-associated complex subunit beta [Fusarium oxysporum f. sp. albedinis]
MLDVACCKYRSHSSLILRSVVVFRIYSLLDRVARFVVACRLVSALAFFSAWVFKCSPDATQPERLKRKKTESHVGCGWSLMQQTRIYNVQKERG